MLKRAEVYCKSMPCRLKKRNVLRLELSQTGSGDIDFVRAKGALERAIH